MSTTETQAVPAGTWALDPVHSTVGFAVGYMAGTFTGGFGDALALGDRSLGQVLGPRITASGNKKGRLLAFCEAL